MDDLFFFKQTLTFLSNRQCRAGMHIIELRRGSPSLEKNVINVFQCLPGISLALCAGLVQGCDRNLINRANTIVIIGWSKDTLYQVSKKKTKNPTRIYKKIAQGDFLPHPASFRPSSSLKKIGSDDSALRHVQKERVMSIWI